MSSETSLQNKSPTVEVAKPPIGQESSEESQEIKNDSSKGGADAPNSEGNVISPIAKLFGVEQEQTSRCVKCSTEKSKVSPVLLSALMLHDIEGFFDSSEVFLEFSSLKNLF